MYKNLLKTRLEKNTDLLFNIYTLAYALHDDIDQEIPYEAKDIVRLLRYVKKLEMVLEEPVRREAI